MTDILHIARDVAALLITVGGVAGIGGIIGYHLGAAWMQRALMRNADEWVGEYVDAATAIAASDAQTAAQGHARMDAERYRAAQGGE